MLDELTPDSRDLVVGDTSSSVYLWNCTAGDGTSVRERLMIRGLCISWVECMGNDIHFVQCVVVGRDFFDRSAYFAKRAL